MLHRIAITPDVFINAGLREDGGKMLSPLWNIFQDNGLLIDFNGGEWANYIKGLDLPQSVRDKFVAHVCKLKDKNRIINCEISGFATNDIEQWLLLVKEAKRNGLVDFIVCGEEYSSFFEEQENLQFRDSSEVIEFPIEFSNPIFQKMSEAKSWDIKKTENEFLDAISRIFGYARMATIIDPYLSCKHEYYQHSLTVLANVLSRNNTYQTERYLNIYTSKKKSGYTKTQFEKFWTPFLKSIADGFNINVTITLLGASLRTHEQLHDRYLFSEQCGLSIPSDFTIDKKGKERDATWNLLSNDKYTKLVKSFFAGSNFPIMVKKTFFKKKEGDYYE